MEHKLKEIIFNTENFVQNYFKNERTGHDWWHIFRVRNYSLKIAEKEGGNLFLIEMVALLHDLDDWKLTNDSNAVKTSEWLKEVRVDANKTARILEIISQVSFKGAGTDTKVTSPEARVVQDADRLDAMGAIGIARAFAYGGSKGRLIYEPGIKPEFHNDFETYKKNSTHTINHFYEKLLLLKDRMNTACGREMADVRHRFMENYLAVFFDEWEAKI